MAQLNDTMVQGDLRVTGTVYGNLTGNAATATSAGKLTTARKTYVTLGTASTTTTRDWSGDTTIPVSGTLAISNGGTGATQVTGSSGALHNLTNDQIGTASQWFLTITNSWQRCGYCSVDDAKTVLGLGSAAYLNTGTTSGTVALGNHAHGNIASGGTLSDTAAAAAGNDYVVIRDADNAKIQTSTIKGTDVADAISKKHSHSTLTLSTTAQAYDGSHTLALPSTDPYTSARTPASHTHGNIANGGILSDTAAAAAGNDYVVIRDADNSKIQTSTIKGTDVADAVSKKHSHSTLTLSTTAQAYDGSHTLALPSSDPYTSARTPASHTHGNIANGGTLSDTAAAAAGNDYVVIRDADNSKIQTSTIKGTDVADAVSKKHSHSSLTLSTTAQKYDGSHTLALPSSDPYTSARTPSSHTHGNIQNGGTLQTNDVTIASGDKLVITDSSDSNKVARASISFDGSTTSKALTPKGTFETFLTSHQSLSGYVPTSRTINSKALTGNISLTASDVGAAASGHTHSVKINGSTKTIAASGGTAVDLGRYLTKTDLTSPSVAGGIWFLIGETTISSWTNYDEVALISSRHLGTGMLVLSARHNNSTISLNSLGCSITIYGNSDAAGSPLSGWYRFYAKQNESNISLRLYAYTADYSGLNANHIAGSLTLFTTKTIATSDLITTETDFNTAISGWTLKATVKYCKITDTTYTSKSAASGGTDVSLVTTGEKYNWNAKSTLALGETSSTAYRGDRGKTAYDHSQATHAPTTSSAAASGGTTLSLVTTGEKYTWNNKSTLALGETSSTAYRGDRGKTAYDHSQATHAPTTSAAAASGGTTLSLVTTGEKYTWNSKAAGNHNHDATYMKASSGNKSLSFGLSTIIGTANGSDVKLVMPEANADVYPVSANLTSFSDVLAAYNAHKKLILQIGFNMPGTLTAIYNIPLNRIVYSDDTPVIFVWVYTQDSLTGDTNRGVITTWSLGSTGWASDEKYTYYSDTAGLSEKASALIDFGDTSRMTRVGWGGSSIGKVIASGSSMSLSESSFLAGYYVAEGMGHVKDVKAANVTVGNATKWNGWSIVVGSTGTDANTLYFV